MPKKDPMLQFAPKSVSKSLLQELPDRSRKILVDRFGLGGKSEERTLDAIGKEYGITRERVRQIENHGLTLIRQGENYETQAQVWKTLKDALTELGEVVVESDALDALAKNDSDRNHLIFLLTVGNQFGYRR